MGENLAYKARTNGNSKLEQLLCRRHGYLFHQSVWGPGIGTFLRLARWFHMRQQELRTLLGVITVDTHELILSYYSDKRAHSFSFLQSLNPPLDKDSRGSPPRDCGVAATSSETLEGLFLFESPLSLWQGNVCSDTLQVKHLGRKGHLFSVQ